MPITHINTDGIDVGWYCQTCRRLTDMDDNGHVICDRDDCPCELAVTVIKLTPQPPREIPDEEFTIIERCVADD